MPGLQPPSTVILESKKIKSVAVSVVSPSICHEVMGPDDTALMAESEEPLDESERGE